MYCNTLLPEEIKAILIKENLPAFRASQIFNWLHKHLVSDFSLMTNIPKADQEILSQKFKILKPSVNKLQKSKDGTRKYLLEFEDKNCVEAVLLFNKGGRKTVCISTQAGCPLSCRICATGKMGFKRNLTSDEIIAQIELLYKEKDGFENVVFMGMGEPLLNLENVLKSIEIVNHEDGLNIGARKITISTVGISEKILELARFDKQVRLAVSINSAIEEKRSQIMPINKKYPLSKLIPAVKKYIEKTGRRVTFEYIMIKDFNDLEDDLYALLELCQGLNVNVNLIPLNPTDSEYLPSSPKVQQWFLDQLLKNKVNTVLRQSKGSDIAAACGQLAGKYD